MKMNVLKLQGIVFIMYTVFVFLFFVSMLTFASPYYETFLYGNMELVEFYDTKLQEYNQFLFVIAIINVVLFLVVLGCGPRKYYPSFITYPIQAVIMLVGIITAILAITKMMPIMEFYKSYDYSSISKLKDFTQGFFWQGLTITASVGMIISNILSIVIGSFGLNKYIKGRGEAYD